MDVVSKTTRSRMMAAVRSKNTAPEVQIRHRLFNRGFRYRLHAPSLPGRPDIVFPKYHAVVFVSGCYWHNHDCHFGRLPATRRNWWKRKLESNRKRDARVLSELRQMGWRTLVVWECSVKGAKASRIAAFDTAAERAARFLLSKRTRAEFPSPRSSGTGNRRSGDTLL